MKLYFINTLMPGHEENSIQTDSLLTYLDTYEQQYIEKQIKLVLILRTLLVTLYI